MSQEQDKHTDSSLSRLIAMVGRAHAQRADAYMERIGLFRGQAVLLMILSEQEGMTHSEIASRLHISPAAATKVIKRMEALKYVRRLPDASDDRVSRVYLQREGRAVIEQIRRAFREIDLTIRNDLTAQEQDELFRLLQQVHLNLTA